MSAFLAELPVNIFGVILIIEDLLLSLVEGGLNERVTSSPLANAVVLLENHLRLVIKATIALCLGSFVEHARHHVHQCLTFIVLLLHYPVPALRAFMWVCHKWVRASTTLVETIVSESWIALTDCLGAFLDACSVIIAFLITSVFLT